MGGIDPATMMSDADTTHGRIGLTTPPTYWEVLSGTRLAQALGSDGPKSAAQRLADVTSMVEMGSSALTGIWAHANTREALFAAWLDGDFPREKVIDVALSDNRDLGQTLCCSGRSAYPAGACRSALAHGPSDAGPRQLAPPSRRFPNATALSPDGTRLALRMVVPEARVTVPLPDRRKDATSSDRAFYTDLAEAGAFDVEPYLIGNAALAAIPGGVVSIAQPRRTRRNWRK